MFAQNLGILPLTGGIAEEFFSRIRGSSLNGDTSFLATLRVLLHNRLDKSESFSLNIEEFSMSAAEIAATDTPSLLRASRIQPQPNSIILLNLRCGEDASERFFERLDDSANGFIALNEGYRELADVKAFASKWINARFYINSENHSCVIVTRRLSGRTYHFLQGFIPRYLPLYFEGDQKLSEKEMELLKALISSESGDRYKALISEFYDSLDLRSFMIHSVIGGFEKDARAGQLNSVRNQIENTRMEIKDHETRITSLYSRIDELNVREAGLSCMIASGESDSELIDYFIHNKSLIPIGARDGRIEIVVKTYLEIFDPDMFDTMINRNGNHFMSGYSTRGVFDSDEARKAVLNAIFSFEPKFRIKTCGYYRLNITGGVESRDYYNYPAECSDRMPNPHLHYHRCLGNHERFIKQKISEGDMLSAIEQCVSSAKSINLGEGITVRRFVEDLFMSDEKVLERDDGVCMTPREAYEWLTAKPEEKEAE